MTAVVCVDAIQTVLDATNPALTMRRHHRSAGPGIWYASSTENGAWAELFRHHEPGGDSPLEVIGRIGRARIKGLRLLDLTSARVREFLEVSERELTGDDLTRCQGIAGKLTVNRIEIMRSCKSVNNDRAHNNQTVVRRSSADQGVGGTDEGNSQKRSGV